LSSFSPLVGEIGPSVAARLAAACQSTLIGRTLQAYGGIVQVITEARAPYKILSVSPGWQRLSGWTRDEVVGRTLKLLQGPMTEPDALAALMRGVHTQQPVSLRLTNYTKTGVSFVHQLSCEPLRDPAGETQCFQATSLVLRRPGEAEAAEELAVGHMPTVCRDQVPPLWPLLGSRSLQPEPPQQPAPSADDDFDLFGWCHAPLRPSSLRLSCPDPTRTLDLWKPRLALAFEPRSYQVTPPPLAFAGSSVTRAKLTQISWRTL